MKSENSTITALSTPPGRGALAVIRITGPDAHAAFHSVVKEKDRFRREEARKLTLYTIIDKDGKIIDEVTAVKFENPKSFTGEDMVELICHGGPIIINKILHRLMTAGVQAAPKGEFSRRAFLNGKIDLLKAEAIKALIDSQTDVHFSSAQNAYQGKQKTEIKKFRNRLVDLISDVESRIEFGEEEDDIKEEKLSGIKDLEKLCSDLDKELKRSERIKAIEDGLQIVLAGPANAGKSTLFNEILGYDRSIVHNIPGTTRDSVSEKIEYEGTMVKISDCAGIRETEDLIEQAGIRRTKKIMNDSHHVFWVTSAEELMDEKEKKSILELKEKVYVILNKIDLKKAEEKKQFFKDEEVPFIEISLKEQLNLDKFNTEFSRVLRKSLDSVVIPDIVGNERQHAILKKVYENIVKSMEHFDREEIAAYYLRQALGQFDEICGHTENEEVLNTIFGKFCIGK
ncbi:MAG: tRNA uridine-5-carboxymethylaminomethyl(34) synthesis GTPase MnmE [Chitinispirillaceae bacterium]